MKQNTKVGLLLLAILSPVMTEAQLKRAQQPAMTYPETKKTDIKDNYFGTEVADPYRWLEDDRSEETKAWVKAQNAVTQRYMGQIPYRNEIKARLTHLMNYEKYSQPFKEGAYTYFYKNTGLQNQSVLYRQKEGGAPEIFLDPNTFSKDATTSLAGIDFSKDGSICAYQLSAGGSDWTNVVVMKTDDKALVGDTLRDVKFSGDCLAGQ